MPDKSYYNRLYAFQDDIMRIILRQEVDFYLTGGTALSRCYLNHRYSDDLDFFINQSPEFKKQAQRVVTAIRQHNINGLFLLIRKFWIKSACRCMMTFFMDGRIRWGHKGVD